MGRCTAGLILAIAIGGCSDDTASGGGGSQPECTYSDLDCSEGAYCDQGQCAPLPPDRFTCANELCVLGKQICAEYYSADSETEPYVCEPINPGCAACECLELPECFAPIGCRFEENGEAYITCDG